VTSASLGGLAPLVPELLAGRPLAVLTGAGVSAESGLPTFRGPGGIWEGRNAMELATPEAFAEDAARVWRFYEWRRMKLREARPNAGHVALARMETLVPRVTLVTQNVDGLHRLAGSRNVLELHGTILATRCTGCGARDKGPDAPFPALPPFCACGKMLRPDVVWFGEMLPEGVFEAAAEAAAESFVFLVVGTSSVVAPASSLAMIASRGGAKVFEVNPEETPLAPFADGCFRQTSAAFLPLLADALERERGVA
jgi:NAD-dependent deacetylase